MDVCLLIKKRLEELDFEQKDLAAAAQVTESYVSQLLTRRKLPPDPERTDIYEKIDAFLKLPGGTLERLAVAQRRNASNRGSEDPPAPLHAEVRELILRKCAPESQRQVRAIFERQPFGELERMVTQKLLDVIQAVAREELQNEPWLRSVARLGGRSYKQMRVGILEFLDTDVYHLSGESCRSFLDPLLESWDVDPGTFAIGFVLNHRLVPGAPRRFELVERNSDLAASEDEPGLVEFLQSGTMSEQLTREEIEFLRRLKFKGRRPTALYFYRELQNLRDPLHFRAA